MIVHYIDNNRIIIYKKRGMIMGLNRQQPASSETNTSSSVSATPFLSLRERALNIFINNPPLIPPMGSPIDVALSNMMAAPLHQLLLENDPRAMRILAHRPDWSNLGFTTSPRSEGIPAPDSIAITLFKKLYVAEVAQVLNDSDYLKLKNQINALNAKSIVYKLINQLYYYDIPSLEKLAPHLVEKFITRLGQLVFLSIQHIIPLRGIIELILAKCNPDQIYHLLSLRYSLKQEVWNTYRDRYETETIKLTPLQLLSQINYRHSDSDMNPWRLFSAIDRLSDTQKRELLSSIRQSEWENLFKLAVDCKRYTNPDIFNNLINIICENTHFTLDAILHNFMINRGVKILEYAVQQNAAVVINALLDAMQTLTPAQKLSAILTFAPNNNIFLKSMANQKRTESAETANIALKLLDEITHFTPAGQYLILSQSVNLLKPFSSSKSDSMNALSIAIRIHPDLVLPIIIAIQNLNGEVPKAELDKLFANITCKDLFDAMNNMPLETQKALLQQCLIPHSPLHRFMTKKEITFLSIFNQNSMMETVINKLQAVEVALAEQEVLTPITAPAGVERDLVEVDDEAEARAHNVSDDDEAEAVVHDRNDDDMRRDPTCSSSSMQYNR